MRDSHSSPQSAHRTDEHPAPGIPGTPERHGITSERNPGEPWPTYVAGLSLRLTRRVRVYLHASLGRYYATGIDRSHSPRWGHYGIRLPFLTIGLIRGTQHYKIRATFMGWRGINHRPRPAFREFTR